jgi:signal transduction histidine kinase
VFPTLIDDLFVTVRPLADEHGCKLDLSIDEEIRVITDPRRVRQILLNLLSNAIKFGRGQPITVNSKPTSEGGIVLEVTDHGEGIAPADLEKIFDEFVQLGKTQLTEGTGLGLPISRRLAELLRGSLTLHSELGKGSTFRLSLPATAERVANVRLSDQDITPPPSDDRVTRPPEREEQRSEDASEPHTASRMAS